jgi:hypothetical protein
VKQEEIVGAKSFPQVQAFQNVLGGDRHPHHLWALQPSWIIALEA